MKKAIFLVCLLSFATANAQFEMDNPYEGKIERVLAEANTIKQLLSSKKQVESQLLDIQNWTKEETLSETSYHLLKSHYQEYSEQMNHLISALCSDLGSAEKLNQLKGKKVNHLVKHFGEKNIDQLELVKRIYEEKWKPTLEIAATEANSKAIIPTLLLILEFGDSMFSSLKELFTKGSVSKENRKKLFSMGLTYAIDRIETKLKYPKWEEIVVSQPFESNYPRNYSSVAPNAPSSKHFVALNDFTTQKVIGLRNISKKITVGSHTNESNGNLFTTQDFMKNGDRFHVVVSGYEHIYFFYYDLKNERWMDPFGKRIVVGTATETTYKHVLPSANEFFEIEGSQPNEEFLILVCSKPLSQKERFRMMETRKRGALFMEHLSLQMTDPNILALSSIDWDVNDRITLPENNGTKRIIPILISIEKEIF